MAQHSSTSEHLVWSRRRLMLAAAAVFVMVGLLLGACSNRISPATRTPSSVSSPAATPATSAVPTPTTTPAATAAASAVTAVIEKANQEQQLALAQKDTTVMRDTATAAYYSQLVQTQQAMRQAGVTAIKLVSLIWGAVTVQGTNAQAATTETWQVTYANGNTQQNTDRNVYTLVQQGGAWLIANDVQVGSSNNSQPGAGGPNQSRNWSGYAATGGTFTAVSGTWTVPQVSASSSAGSADATWVGIGGVSANDLIQAGTQAAVNGSGQVSYTAWLEMLPQTPQPVTLTIQPGDVISVSISQTTAGSWQVSISDQTTAKSYQTTVQYSSSLSSAEWIEEAPSSVSSRARVITLDDFGRVQFQGASTELNGQQVTIAQAGGQPITMYGQSGAIATTSALGSDGASFTVTRVASTVP